MIGAALMDTAAADRCLRIVQPAAFYREQHRRVWAAIAKLRADKKACDALTVADELQRSRDLEAVGGIVALTDWVLEVPASGNAAEWAAIIVRCHARREALSAARQLAAAAEDPESGAEELRAAIRRAERAVAEAEAGARQTVGLDELAVSAYRRAEEVAEGQRRPGVPTGLRVLDLALGGGMPRGGIVVLAGRPGEGKSSLAQQVACDVARSGRRVYVASAEMPEEDVGDRVLAWASGVDSRRLRGTPALQGEDWESLSRALGEVGQWGRLVRVDCRCQSVSDIVSTAEAEHAREPVDLVVIDHLHHLQGQGRRYESREQELDAMIRRIAALARDLQCAVLLVAQLNRSAPGEKREPRMHDLRGSGSIEQVAHVVLLLHSESTAMPRKVKVIADKSRMGVRGTFELQFDPRSGRWRDAS